MELMNTYIIESFLEPIIAGVGIAIATAFFAICAAGLKYLVSRSRNENLRHASSFVLGICETVVVALMQTSVSQVKGENGISNDQADFLKKKAIKQVEEIIPLRTSKLLTKSGVNITQLIDTFIEQSVYISKGRKE